MAERGISLLDLAALPAGSQSLIPAGLAQHLENLAVIDHHSTSSPGSHIHEGVVQPIADLGFPSLRDWPVEVPGLNTGLPFRLVRSRTPPAAGQNLEPAGTGLFLDLVVDRIAITVPGLRPAALVPSAPGVVAHLMPDLTSTDVRIVGSGVVRIDLSGTGDIVRFVDWPDPFDPAAPSGAVYRLSFEPISFFLGDSELGLTVDRLIWDASEAVTPPEILARGQTPGWQGISIAEATLFLPPNAPLVEDLNVGVKNVLLGSPAGLQGEIHLELGRTPVNPDLVEFLQDFGGSEQTRTPAGTGTDLSVPLITGTPSTARMRGRLPSSVAGLASQPRLTWTLPDGSFGGENDTSWFTASVGETAIAVPSELVDGERVSGNPINYTFTQSEPQVQHPPHVVLTLSGAEINNVVSVSGTAAELNLLEFHSAAAVGDAQAHTWQVGTGPGAQSRSGYDFILLAEALPVGTHYLVYADDESRSRRVRIDVLAEGQLLVGAEGGVFDRNADPVTPRGVSQTHQLAAFHRDGSLTDSADPATLSGTTVTVPDGGLAEVTVELGAGVHPEQPPPPVTEEEVRRLQVLFEYQTDNPTVWGAYVPKTREATIESTIAAWAAFFPGAQFVVIGRCCDIGSADFNTTLAQTRAAKAVTWLPGGGTLSRGEHDAPSAAMTTAQDAISPALESDEKVAQWLIKSDFTDAQRTAWGTSTTHEKRVSYRRVDIFAVGGTYTPPAGADPTAQMTATDLQQTDASLRRSYQPGDDLDTIALPGRREPSLPFLVRISVAWDSPTVTSLSDAIPTQAEFTFEWASDNVTIPTAAGTDDLEVRPPSQTAAAATTEVFTLTGRFSHDSRSGQTVFSLSIASSGDPKGLAAVDSEALAIALALAPALLAGIGAAGVDGAAVRLAALAIAAGVLASLAKDGEVIIHSAEIEHRQRSLTDATGFRTRVLLDYTAAFGLDVAADGLGAVNTSDGYPLKVRYKKVGLEFDGSKTEWYEKFGLVYEDASFEVADPGRWTVAGPLGQLLQVVASRAGVGSTWFELDLEFVLDLGIVTITGATVRVVFDDGGISAELRGLGLSVEIPGVLIGAGRLVLGEGGAFKAALEIDLVSVGAKGMGALAFDPAEDFLSVALGLLLPVGIPLGSSGLGVFGFLGQFVSNGRRALPSGFANDPVGREIEWYRNTPAEDKFEPHRGQWALGLGAIVGTMPDQAFTFNATGMLVVAFPDPAVIFGIDAKLVQQPAVAPKDADPGAAPSFQILGLVAIDDTAVMVGVRGSYELPKVFRLNVPIDGYFPYPTTPGDAYVRIGSDGQVAQGRPGDPVSITLLPDTLDARAFSYLMVEEKQLLNLGGDDRFDFYGFCVGFGAGWEIRWSAGPIKLEAGAKVLVGLGTDPFLLKGGIMVHGELDLVVVSVGANGDIVATVWDEGGLKINLKGEFCGHVDLFFFELEGCVGIEIGDPLTPSAPPPPPPIGKVSLTDRRGYTTAVAVTGTPGEDQTVWPDTVPVIEFTHHVIEALPASSAFDPGPGPGGPVWSGTSEMKYAYRLTGVELVEQGGGQVAGPLDSAWWLPTHRPGVLADGDVAVSAEEGMFLALLSWDPAPWTYWLTDGGEGTDGDPAGVPGRLCDKPPRSRRNCALGKSGRRTAPDAVRFLTEDPASPPFPNRFEYLPQERILGSSPAMVAPLLSASGLAYTPGAVGPGPFGDDVWWLGTVTQYGFTERTAELDGPLAPEIVAAELELVVCRDRRKRPQVPADKKRTCHDVQTHRPRAGVDLGSKTTIGPVGVHTAGGSLHVLDTGGGTALRFPDAGVTCQLPEAVDEVTVTLFLRGQPVEVEAYDANGKLVGAGASGSQQGVMQEVTITGPGIVTVVLHGGSGEASLVRICWTTIAAAPAPARIDRSGSEVPVVIGTWFDERGRGVEEQWKPEVTKNVRTETGECSLVTYTPPREARWAGLRVREWSGTGKNDPGRVGLVRLCGVSAEAAAQAAANAAAGQSLTDAIADHAVGDGPARRDLLKPDTTYEIRVSWQWQGWVKTAAQPAPPTLPPDGDWNNGADQVLRFRTAEHVSATGSPPAELIEESVFDPRSLLRYLIAFDPDKGSAPHLLDDELLVHLAVDHLDQLAGLYGLGMGLRLRRTDPPPGSLAGQDHPPDENLAVSWGPLYDEYRPLGQRRFIEAIREAPCLGEPALGGTTGAITADLVPGARYDLTLVAAPASQPDAEGTVISRAHFQASRYRSAADLLEALGFTGASIYPILAGDAIITGSLPGSGLVVGDAALDAALAGAGMDPWPLPDAPRSNVLWRRDGTAWKFAGLLLEAPEPIVRSGRTSLEIGDVKYATIVLTQVRRNAAGTRVLLAPAAATDVPPGVPQMTVDLVHKVTDAAGTVTTTTATGSRRALAIPRSVYQEAGA